MKLHSKVLVMLGALHLTALNAAAADPAKAYPSKPIRMIAPYSAGAGVDLITRVIGLKFTEAWGQQVIVDNRAGAGAVIGTDIAAKAVPDGYTLIVVNPAHAINPGLLRKLPYDSINDFAPVTLIATQPNVVAVNPALPVKDVQDLIALAKAKPRGINYVSAGIGSAAHLATELFASIAGVEMTHVPYKGGAPAMLDVISGRAQIFFVPMLSVWQHVQSGRLRALAVTSPKRSASAPDLPTVAESGLPGYQATAWYMLLAPAKTPKAIVAKVNAETVKAMQKKDVKERLIREGADPIGSSTEEAAHFLKSEIELWTKVIKSANVRPE